MNSASKSTDSHLPIAWLIEVYEIAELNIVKLESCSYEAYCEGASDNLVHSSISDVLLHFGTDIPEEFATFVNVEYAGVRLATMPILALANDSERLASELIQLVAEIHNGN